MNLKKILIFTIILLVPFFYYIKIVDEYEKELKEELVEKETILYNKKNSQLKALLVYYNNSIDSMIENKNFQNFLTKKDYDKDIINEGFITFLKNSENIFKFRFIDLEGNEVIKVSKNNSLVSKDENLQNKKHRYYFKEAINLKKSETWYSKLDLNKEHKKITTPYIATLRLAKAVYLNEKKYGILIISINLNSFLDEIIKNEDFNISIIDKDNYILKSNLKEYDWNRYLQNSEKSSTLIKIINSSFKKRLSIENKEELYIVFKTKEEKIQNKLKEKILELKLYILILIILFLYVYKIIVSRKELESLNYKLEEKVDKQTKQIKSNFAILNKHLIYSRTDLKGILIEVSDAFCKISGYTRDEMLGQPQSLVRHPDMPKELFQDLWKTIKSGKVWTGEIKNLNKNGSYYWTSAIITPEFDENSKVVSYMSIRHDITLKKDSELQSLIIMQQTKMAALGEMIGNIAHQWRQPLSIISTTSSGLALSSEVGILTDEDIQKYNKIIIENTDYLSQTIEVFRNFTAKSKEKETIILQSRIDAVINVFNESLKSNSIQIINESKNKNPVNIFILVGELDQVLINIISNARDALKVNSTENAWIKIDLIQEDKKVTITIEDNAGGIPENLIGKIFEPYFTTKHTSQGTGLGLYLSYKIVHESLKGKLYVENSEEGAKFHIELVLEEPN